MLQECFSGARKLILLEERNPNLPYFLLLFFILEYTRVGAVIAKCFLEIVFTIFRTMESYKKKSWLFWMLKGSKFDVKTFRNFSIMMDMDGIYQKTNC